MTDWNELVEALVRTRLVEVAAEFDKEREQVSLPEHQNVIEALSANTSQEALTHGVGPRSSHRSFENPRTHANGDAVELRPVLVVAIADQEARAYAKGRRMAQLLSDPAPARLARHGDVHHATRADLDDEEGEDRPEPGIMKLEEIAGPGLVAMVAQERSPTLLLRGTFSHPA